MKTVITQLSVNAWVFGRANPTQAPTSHLQMRRS
jgi:hypothetical protein